MKLLDEVEIAIRIAFAEAVHRCGKGANAAAILETNEGKISRLQNIENTERAASERVYLKAAEAVRIDRLAGEPIVLSAMAALEGYEITAADRHSKPLGMHRHLSVLAKEFGEACTQMAEGADSVSKAKRIRAELQELVNRARDCIAECDHVIAGEKLKVVS
jgi:hypothetical protein